MSIVFERGCPGGEVVVDVVKGGPGLSGEGLLRSFVGLGLLRSSGGGLELAVEDA